jgi:hypothetical protein
MKPDTTGTAIQLLAFGLILAVVKLVYMFFEAYGILDVIVFLAAGFLLGGKVPPGKKALGLLLALPAFTLCLLFVIKNGYTSIINGIGTGFAISLMIIPVATMIGIFLNAKRTRSRGVLRK